MTASAPSAAPTGHSPRKRARHPQPRLKLCWKHKRHVLLSSQVTDSASHHKRSEAAGQKHIQESGNQTQDWEGLWSVSTGGQWSARPAELLDLAWSEAPGAPGSQLVKTLTEHSVFPSDRKGSHPSHTINGHLPSSHFAVRTSDRSRQCSVSSGACPHGRVGAGPIA